MVFCYLLTYEGICTLLFEHLFQLQLDDYLFQYKKQHFLVDFIMLLFINHYLQLLLFQLITSFLVLLLLVLPQGLIHTAARFYLYIRVLKLIFIR